MAVVEGGSYVRITTVRDYGTALFVGPKSRDYTYWEYYIQQYTTVLLSINDH
jgi:hypothetical protein